eukprot:101584_1
MAQSSKPSDWSLDKHLISLLKVNDNGWNVSLFQDQKTINDSLCGNCKAVCRDAVTLGCDHEDGDIVLFCESCLNEVISNNANTCPINQHLDPIICPVGAVRCQILNSPVICPYSTQFQKRNTHAVMDTIGCDQKEGDVVDGCEWKGTLNDLLSSGHLHRCTTKYDATYTFIQKLQIEKMQTEIQRLHKIIEQQKQTIDEQSVRVNDLLCVTKEVTCEPEMKFEVGDHLDVRDGCGKWYDVIVKIHKQAKEKIPKQSPPLNKEQIRYIEYFKHLEALYVDYTAWDDKWSEWIFIEPGRTVCTCHAACNTDTHRVAVHRTQCKLEENPKRNSSVDISSSSLKSFIVDVHHRRCNERVNKPIRHVFHVDKDKDQKVRDLARMVAIVYDTKSQFVLFYENWNMKVAREYDHNIMLGMVPDRDALACYILKDWNEEVTPQEIKKKDLSLQIAKVCHSAPLSEKKGRSRDGPLFGMPFVISFLNVHTRRQVHQVIYQKLFMWVGPDVLAKPPTITKLKKIPKTTKDTKEKPKDESNEDKDKKKDKEDAEKEEIEYEYIAPSKEEMEKYEAEWDAILKDVPYTLRLLPYRHYSFYSSKTPEEIPIDDVVFVAKLRNDKDIDIIIEWGTEPYNKIKTVVNKVVVDAEYSQYKKEKQKRSQDRGGGKEQLSLYDCINSYVAQETLGENDLWYCAECKKHEQANKKLDLWSFPEILIIHLKRFQVLSVGRFGRGEKISTFVDCPIRGLDLTPYLITGDNETAPPIYDLYAVSCHSGSCGGGHYTAYALNDETDRWYYFNDSSVRPAKQSDIVSQSTYVLFYKKCH